MKQIHHAPTIGLSFVSRHLLKDFVQDPTAVGSLYCAVTMSEFPREFEMPVRWRPRCPYHQQFARNDKCNVCSVGVIQLLRAQLCLDAMACCSYLQNLMVSHFKWNLSRTWTFLFTTFQLSVFTKRIEGQQLEPIMDPTTEESGKCKNAAHHRSLLKAYRGL